MNKKLSSLLVLFVGVLFFAAPATAALQAVGPINPVSGFPNTYTDTAGVSVDLPVPVLGDGLNIPTMIFDPVNSAFPLSTQIGFGTEAFYWFARAIADTGTVGGGPGRAILTMGLEAAFLNTDAIPGDQMVFQRIRIRVDIPDDGGGTYTVTHPYGSKTFTNVVPGLVGQTDPVSGLRAGINDTVDIGAVPISLAPTLALTGPIGPFLRQVAPAPPAGWIGDGVSVATVTGSPTGFNSFRVDGPNIGGPGVNSITQNLFTVSGHLAAGASAITNAKVTFRRTATQTTLQFLANAPTGSTMAVMLPAATPGGARTRIVLKETTPGTFFASRTLNTATLPASVRFNATVGGVAATPVIVTSITDNVTVTKAEWSQSTRRLVVVARSSDSALPTFTLTSPLTVEFLPGSTRLNIRVNSAPASVVVTSSSGGTTAATPVTTIP